MRFAQEASRTLLPAILFLTVHVYGDGTCARGTKRVSKCFTRQQHAPVAPCELRWRITLDRRSLKAEQRAGIWRKSPRWLHYRMHHSRHRSDPPL